MRWLGLVNRYGSKRAGYARVDADDVYGATVADLASVRSVHSYRGALVAVAGVAQPRMYAESQAGWVDLREAASWQLTAGVEFEPVGGLRYLLGLY